MSNVNEQFDFDAVINEAEKSNKVCNGRGLSAHLYEQLHKAEGMKLSWAQMKLLTKGYQFNKKSTLEKYQTFNNGVTPANHDEVKAIALSLSQSKKATDKALLQTMVDIGIKANERVTDALKKAVVSGADKRTTNIPYAPQYYPMTTKVIKNVSVELVER